ncbi:MAG: WD40 repeat domain-containing protein, partial [bacterium]|nr:WD40 repeat domain-containing protein [bacterium]
FSPVGAILASGSRDGTLRLWDASRRPLAVALAGESQVWSVAFSPDGSILASASFDGTVQLWNVASRHALGAPLAGHEGWVLSVAFSPSGKIVASAGFDDTVRLWDVASRQPFGEPLTGPKGWVESVAFSPDGKTLASAGRDIPLWLWNVDPDSWVARACRRANRNFSLAEWRQYLGSDVPYRRTCPDLPPGEGVEEGQ